MSNAANSPRRWGAEELCSSQCGNLPGFTERKPVPGTHIQESTSGERNIEARQNSPLVNLSYSYSLTTKLISFKLKLMHWARQRQDLPSWALLLHLNSVREAGFQYPWQHNLGGFGFVFSLLLLYFHSKTDPAVRFTQVDPSAQRLLAGSGTSAHLLRSLSSIKAYICLQLFLFHTCF